MPDRRFAATILDALDAHVATVGERIAYTLLADDESRETITFRELQRRVHQLAIRLRRQAGAGERALLLCPFGLDFIFAFLACLAARLIAVPAFPPRRNQKSDRLTAIVADCQPRLLLCTRKVASAVENSIPSQTSGSLLVCVEELMANPTIDDKGGISPASGDIAFLQYTSGSTTSPRGVAITHANIVANESAIEQNFGTSCDSVCVNWLPMFHDMGLIGGVLHPLFVGFPCVLMPPSAFLTRPIRWLRAVSEFRGTISGGPNFAYQHCVERITPEEKQNLDLSSWATAFNGAEPIRAETLDAFSTAFASCGFQPRQHFPCYGLAESTLFVSGGPAGQTPRRMFFDPHAREAGRFVEAARSNAADVAGPHSIEVVSCGRPARDAAVKIVHPETHRECAGHEIGEIWLRGPSVATGYWQSSDETAWRTQLACDPTEDQLTRAASATETYFRTGDLGILRDGELYVTGRIKDLMIVGGRNIYPQDIETLFERHFPFVKQNDCAAVSVRGPAASDEIIVVATATRDMVRCGSAESGATQLREWHERWDEFRNDVWTELTISIHRAVFVSSGTFPKTSSGKVRRPECARAFCDRSLEIVFECE